MQRKAGAILSLFRDQDGFISGERISRELQVSRTAIWKQVNNLRKAGYIIEAVPSQGYRLISTPDILSSEQITEHLTAQTIGCRLVCLSDTASTNSDAFRLAEQGAAEGTVVLADSQASGKGRMGRIWSSPPGINLYCSVILRPGIMPYEAPQLTFLSAVAVARAIESVTTLKPKIKWPNDVLIGTGKVAGLLNEMSAETDGINFVILGIGVNLNMKNDQFPPELRHPATSLLLESGQRISRSRFAAILFNELDHLYSEFLIHGFGPVRAEWQQRCNAHDRELTVSDGGMETVRGMFGGIDGDGVLLVSLTDGSIIRILSGDVRVL